MAARILFDLSRFLIWFHISNNIITMFLTLHIIFVNVFQEYAKKFPTLNLPAQLNNFFSASVILLDNKIFLIVRICGVCVYNRVRDSPSTILNAQ